MNRIFVTSALVIACIGCGQSEHAKLPAATGDTSAQSQAAAAPQDDGTPRLNFATMQTSSDSKRQVMESLSAEDADKFDWAMATIYLAERGDEEREMGDYTASERAETRMDGKTGAEVIAEGEKAKTQLTPKGKALLETLKKPKPM